MADHHPNATYIEAMSAILIQFFVPTAGEDDLVDKCVDQLIETYVFDGLHENEAARILNSILAAEAAARASTRRIFSPISSAPAAAAAAPALAARAADRCTSPAPT